MSTTTSLLTLTKPDGSDPALISIINSNMDILDNAVTLAGTQSMTNKTLTGPHMTTPVVDSGGLTITAGGLTVTAGGILVSAGGLTVTGTVTLNGNALANGAFGAGTAWTPSITQGGTNPTSTNNGSWFIQIGKLVLVTLNITASSAGSAGNVIIISSLPAGGPRFTGSFASVGAFSYSRAAGAGIHVGSAVAASSTNLEFLSSQGTGGYMGQANGPSFAVASGDVLGATLIYEAA